MLTHGMKSPDLSVKEQREHIKRIQDTNDEESWRLIVAQFAPAIASISKGFTPTHYEDREIRESILLRRLISSVRKFDHDCGVRPSTYIMGAFRIPINAAQHKGAIHLPTQAYQTAPDKYKAALYPAGKVTDDCLEYQRRAVKITPLDTAIVNEACEYVHDAIEQLPPDVKYVVKGRMDRRTMPQIGEEMGISRDRVNGLYYKGLGLLREFLIGVGYAHER